jgi:hypothetical protein
MAIATVCLKACVSFLKQREGTCRTETRKPRRRNRCVRSLKELASSVAAILDPMGYGQRS